MLTKFKKILIKKLQRIFKGKDCQNIYICINLWCPDGERESLGFFLPKEIDAFITYMNTWNKIKGYTIELYKI